MIQFLSLNLEPERETSTTGNFNGVNSNNLINIPLTESLRNRWCSCKSKETNLS